ncbi:monovalent cation/H+ antiporter complex subunit F [Alishewanella longhuensis]
MMFLALALLLSMLLGLWRVVKGPTLLDRLLTIQLFGSAGVAICLVLAKALALPALLDVALLLAVLAAAAPAALVQRLRRQA